MFKCSVEFIRIDGYSKLKAIFDEFSKIIRGQRVRLTGRGETGAREGGSRW